MRTSVGQNRALPRVKNCKWRNQSMSTVSRYNHFQRWQDGYHIAYNAFSGAVALMTDENYGVYENLVAKLRGPGAAELTEPEAELLKQLEFGGFVRKDGFSEFYDLRFQHHLNRYDRTGLGLVIAPTMACNMACVYCYEEKTKRKMSPEVRTALVGFVEKQAKHLQNLSVDWYGGEPLLALDVIEELTKAFMEMAERYQYTYRASMVSNGYLLTPETVDRLVDWRVTFVQVTLDGPARIHDVKRPLKSKRGSFYKIIENIKYASTKMTVGIRVNVDKSFTPDTITELLAELTAAGLRERVGVHFGMVEAASKVCANISESCYDSTDFSHIEVDYHRLLLEQGFSIDKLPSPLSSFCMASMINSHLIDPEGYLYRCWNHAGLTEKACGQITEEMNYQHPNFRSLFDFSPFDNARCTECDLLPICMGACPSRRLERGLSDVEVCETWKHNLQPMLEIIARSRQQEMQRRSQQDQSQIANKE